MGRGLSELQKHILVIGHERRGIGDDPHDEFVGFSTDVSVPRHFGWGFEETRARLRCRHKQAWRRWRRYKHLAFSVRAVGKQRYQAAVVAVVRAMKRLHDGDSSRTTTNATGTVRVAC